MILHEQFSKELLEWYEINGRKDLPWKQPLHPYRVWISEIMLQQTQVQTVIPYFNRFMFRFPDVKTLAEGTIDEVLALWSGLGYYSRARNLHQSAKIIVNKYQSQFPNNRDDLINLPGIGPSTAAAILSQAFNQAEAILDGNVKRVLARFFMIEGWTEQAQVKKKLWELANQCMPKQYCAEYTQAIMDLGALCCTTKNPNCIACPVATDCLARKNKVQLEYPTKKPPKKIPIYHQQFIVLYNDQGLIYLEKRPPTGIWGGLWCLPSINKEECPLSFIKDKYCLIGEKPIPIIQLKHRFSHFHLEIYAVGIKALSSGKQLAESSGKWFNKELLPTLGLAKPTSQILTKFEFDTRCMF